MVSRVCVHRCATLSQPTFSLRVKGGPMLMALLFFLSGRAVENNCTSAAPADPARTRLGFRLKCR